MLENLVLLGHLITAVAIVGLILMQQGKGAEMGASFGAGASQTLFGSSGAGNFFSRLTAIFAAIFFVTSFSLAVMAKHSTNIEDDLGLPAIEEVDVPTIEGLEESDLPEAINDSNINVDSASESVEAVLEELPQVPEVPSEENP